MNVYVKDSQISADLSTLSATGKAQKGKKFFVDLLMPFRWTRSWFIRRLRHHFSSDVGGHSLRSGGATALAEAGVPPHIIQAIGRWASDAFQIYIRKHPVLLAAMLYGHRSV